MSGGGAGETWTPERSAAGDRSPWLIAGIISMATFMEMLDVSIANVSLDHIAGGLGASFDETTWVITSYLIANAITVPIAGWLSNVVGRKRFYMISVAIFTVSSFLCGIAPNLGLLVMARIVQGIGGGGLAPSEQSMLSETFPPAKRAGAFALYGLTVISAPVFGPILGGLITDHTTWRWIFLLNAPVGLLSLLLVHLFVIDPPKVEEERRARFVGGLKIDYVGIVTLVFWLGCQEFVLDRGQRLDWFSSPAIKAAAVIAAVSLVVMVIWEWGQDEPVFDVQLLLRRSYAIGMLAMLTTGAVVFGTTQIIPQFLQQALGYTATTAGLAMTLGGIATVILMPIAARVTNLVQPKYVLIGGLVSETVALLAFSHLSGDVGWWWNAFARAGVAFGLPFLFIPINTAAYADVPPEKTAIASSQLNLARNVGGSISISLMQAAVEQRSQWHQSRLTETVTPGDPSAQAWRHDLTQALGGQGASAMQAATAEIYKGVVHQAQLLAYIDVFWMFAMAIALVTPLLFFMRKVKPGQGPA